MRGVPEQPDDLYDYEEVGDRLDLRRYGGLLWDGRMIVLAAFVVVFILGTIVTLTRTKIYRASAELLLEPINANPFQLNESVGSNYSQYWINEAFYNTQTQILKSRPLARRVIDRVKLDRQAKYRKAKDLEASVSGLVHVKRVPDTQIVRISIDDTDPKWAAKLANAVAAEYINLGTDERRKRIADFLAWYRDKLRSLSTAVQEGNKAIMGELEKNDLLVGSEGREEILTQKISQLTSDLTKTKTDRIRKEATMAAIAKIKSGRADFLTLPEVQDDPSIQALNKQLTDKDVEMSKLLSRYRPKHPEVIKRKRERDEIKRKLTQEANRIIGRIESEYAILKSQEQKLSASLEQQKVEAREIKRKQLSFQGRTSSLAQRKAILEKLQGVSEQTALAAEFQANNTRIVNPAVSPLSPIKPRVRVNLLLSALGGVMVGVFIVLLLDYLDNTVRTPDQVEEILRLHTLAVVPKSDGSASTKEAYQTLRTGILFANPDRKPRTIMVTSAGPGEGKTSTALNLGQILAKAGDRVIVVEGDLRRPAIHRYLDLERDLGVTDHVAGNADPASLVKKTAIPGLSALTAGPLPPNPPEILGHSRFQELLADFKRSFDWVIVDAPPVLSVTDAVLIAPLMDEIILVVQHGRFARKMIKRAVLQLRNVEARLLGAVLNNVETKSRSYYYGYYGSYDYHAGPSQPEGHHVDQAASG